MAVFSHTRLMALPPDEDEALGSYTHFKAFTPEEQTRAILLLSYRFLKAEPEEVVDDE